MSRASVGGVCACLNPSNRSAQEMSRRYHAQFAGGPSRPSSAQAAASATPRATDETSRPIKREEVRASSASTTSRNPAKTLNWNDFQAANKGKGWSREVR
mmetsp:Transcript_29455/g.94314  ORF Transcript_29455/g.94314 Transcript_29455/m.94314 type:complete len:100 (-) Transcript_29455:61-360(-)